MKTRLTRVQREPVTIAHNRNNNLIQIKNTTIFHYEYHLYIKKKHIQNIQEIYIIYILYIYIYYCIIRFTYIYIWDKYLFVLLDYENNYEYYEKQTNKQRNGTKATKTYQIPINHTRSWRLVDEGGDLRILWILYTFRV